MNRTPRHIVNIAIEQDGYNKGVRDTEDRIIKLLEEMAKSTFPGDVWHINPFDYAIVLIKGENK